MLYHRDSRACDSRKTQQITNNFEVMIILLWISALYGVSPAGLEGERERLRVPVICAGHETFSPCRCFDGIFDRAALMLANLYDGKQIKARNLSASLSLILSVCDLFLLLRFNLRDNDSRLNAQRDKDEFIRAVNWYRKLCVTAKPWLLHLAETTEFYCNWF